MRAAALLAVWAASFTACTVPGETAVAVLPPGVWSDPVELLLPNRDTLGTYDWRLFLRYDEHLAPDRFTLQLTVLTPDSLRFSEPVTVQLPSGPAPAALLREFGIDYRRRVRLARTGSYRILLRPQTPLQGIDAVGIQTVKSDTSD